MAGSRCVNAWTRPSPWPEPLYLARARPPAHSALCPAPSRALPTPQCGILPYAGCDIALFEVLNERLHARYAGDPPHLAIIGAGMASSLFAQVRRREPGRQRGAAYARQLLRLQLPATRALPQSSLRSRRRPRTAHAPSSSLPPPPQLVSYPLALVRTRLQAQGVGGNPIKYSGMLDVFSQTLRNEGPAGLYKVQGGGLANKHPQAPGWRQRQCAAAASGGARPRA